MLKNGRSHATASVTVDVTSPAFGLGQSLFETMLVRDRPTPGAVFLADQHVARLTRSATRLGWVGLPDEKTLVRWIRRAAHLFGRQGSGPGRLRLTAVWARADGAPDVFVTVFPYQMQLHPATVVTTPVRLPWADQYGAHKTGSRHVYYLAEQFAAPVKADDALLVDDRGRPAEGARSNLFLVEDGVVWTYPVKHGVLPGVTRMAVLRLVAQHGMEVKEQPVTYERLVEGVRRGDVFLTNALWGVRPVAALDEHRSPAVSAAVKTIRESYQSAAANGLLPGKPKG